MPIVVREMALIKVAAATSEARTEIMRIAEIFRAKIVDVGHTALTVEVTGEEDKVESIIGLYRRLGILELTRTGQVAMVRSSVKEDAEMPAS
jgi:acetolactate synthase-1/3 small subunit